jgi:pyruvate formate lyase activating enzyme
MVGYEYVRDAAKLAKEQGLKTVLVTNGCASVEALKEVLPYIDAMNIDLKGFSPSISLCRRRFRDDQSLYRLGGQKNCHVELTTLIVRSHNDDPKTMEEEAKWIASLDPKIPLHLTRYFPRYKEKEAADSRAFEELSRWPALSPFGLSGQYLAVVMAVYKDSSF